MTTRSPKPTRTTNRLPFSELHPKRFEDLCLALVLPIARWQDLRHYGRSGTDGGVDIFGVEALDGNRSRRWYIQCKCEQRFGAADLKLVIDEAVRAGESVPDVVLVIVTADVSRKAHETFLEYATKKGIPQAFIWSRSIIEARLFSERRDLLYLYFGISTFEEATAKASSISRNIALKKRLQDDFLKPVGSRERGGPPNPNFVFNDIIVRSVDDSKYPDGDYNTPIISSWFKIEPYDFYYNGIELVLSIREVARNAAGQWGLTRDDPKLVIPPGFSTLNAFALGRLPYRFIVDYDMLGDEYNRQPHVFCLFANGGKPYEAMRYAATEKPYLNTLDPENQIELATGKSLNRAG
jgi:hypothetical protein